MIVFRVVATLAGIVFLAFNVPFVGPFVAIFAIRLSWPLSPTRSRALC